jgi:cytochrome c-type biogenesis protein CcmF
VALLGRSLILLSLLFAAAGSVVAFAAGARRSELLASTAKRMALAYSAAMVIANVTMIVALLRHDFSVSYVAQVGSRSVPTWVTIVSLWSSLEGSILFWGLVLALYIIAAVVLLGDRFADYSSNATGVWLACATFFSFLLAGPAQPFLAVSPIPLDGPGPNPLLQNHILMAIHPPFLYLGYVGMTIPFGLACAALMRGHLGLGFLAPLRTALLLPWVFLTIAIVLGGWWAYEVLGWGGYWAWDPVENASLLPWLTATAAMHSAIVMERRNILKGWTVVLILATFLLTILGTFMTRSGVFNSVHSFTQSSIGPTILVFLAIALAFSVVLLAMRIDRLESTGTVPGPASREAMFLANNLLFVLITFTVLVGTVFPLVVEAVRDVQMSVGRPYFDRMTVPAGLALLFLVGVGPSLPWGRPSANELRRALLFPIAGAAIFALVGWIAGARNGWTLATIAAGGYAAYVTLRELWLPVRARMRSGSGLFESFVAAQWSRGRRRFGAYVAHAGVVMIFIAIAVSSTMGTSTEVQLTAGGTTTVGPYQLRFLGAELRQEPHRESSIARIEVRRGGEVVDILEPRMNVYERQREPIGTPSVRSTWSHDLYLSIVNLDIARNRVGLSAMIHPMVSWVWGATGVIALGGLVALAGSLRREVIRPAVEPRVETLPPESVVGELS